MSATVRAAIVIAAATVIASVVTGGFGLFSSQASENHDSKTLDNSFGSIKGPAIQGDVSGVVSGRDTVVHNPPVEYENQQFVESTGSFVEMTSRPLADTVIEGLQPFFGSPDKAKDTLGKLAKELTRISNGTRVRVVEQAKARAPVASRSPWKIDGAISGHEQSA